MASFLEALFGSGPQDPKSQAIAAFSSGLIRRDLASALDGANAAFVNAPILARKAKMDEMELAKAEMELQKARRAQDEEAQIAALAKGAYRSPEMANALSQGPTMDGGAVPAVSPGFDSKQFLQGVYGINPMTGMKLEQSMAKDSPFNKIDPKDFTPASLAKFSQTRNAADLVPYRKKENIGGKAVDMYNVQDGQTLDQVDPNKPFNVVNGQAVANTGFQQYEVNKARAGASNVSVNTGQKGLDNELKIRGDFRGEPIYKAHQDVMAAHSQITQSLKQGSPAGDMAGATKLMKILDPGSVVRESELGMAMAATGLMDRAQNYAQMVMSGQKLTPKQRTDFQNVADALMNESTKQYNAKRAEYGQFGDAYGLDSNRILGPEAKNAPAAAPRPTLRYNPATGKVEPI